MSGRIRAVFFGTPEIAVPALQALSEVADVVLSVCQPDRPKGRGLSLAPPPVKARAIELGIPVQQPTKLKPPGFADSIRALEADIAVVIAYGRILPRHVLEAPRLGCVNLHASLLPRYRGAAPINWAIADGETETGVSLMQMDEGMDTGPVFLERKVPIGPDVTAGDLTVDLGVCAASIVREEIARVVRGDIVATPQDHARATHARLLEKNDGWLDFRWPAKRVHDHARAMTPWPSAFARLDGRTFKLVATQALAETSGAPPGTVVTAAKDRIEIACGQGVLRVLVGQLEGKKALPARDLVAGRTLVAGAIFEGRPEADGRHDAP